MEFQFAQHGSNHFLEISHVLCRTSSVLPLNDSSYLPSWGVINHVGSDWKDSNLAM